MQQYNKINDRYTQWEQRQTANRYKETLWSDASVLKLVTQLYKFTKTK